MPWQKTFPDIFYKELFRLNGWDFTVRGIKRRPGVVGKWANTLIYEQLPKGVVDELKEKTPKSEKGNYTARFFQSLTPETGNAHLTGQLELPFEFDKDSRTIEPEVREPLPELSDFNKSLKRGLEFNPKK